MVKKEEIMLCLINELMMMYTDGCALQLSVFFLVFFLIKALKNER